MVCAYWCRVLLYAVENMSFVSACTYTIKIRKFVQYMKKASLVSPTFYHPGSSSGWYLFMVEKMFEIDRIWIFNDLPQHEGDSEAMWHVLNHQFIFQIHVSMYLLHCTIVQACHFNLCSGLWWSMADAFYFGTYKAKGIYFGSGFLFSFWAVSEYTETQEKVWLCFIIAPRWV